MENPVVEPKPKKTGAIIGTIVAVLLCGCPGLALCGYSAYVATGNGPFLATASGGFPVTPAYGFAGLCVSILLVLIPVVVGLLTLRTRKLKAPKESAPPASGPLPPAF